MAVVTVGEVEGGEAYAVVRAAGLQAVDAGADAGAAADAGVVLVVCEDYLHPGMRSVALA